MHLREKHSVALDSFARPRSLSVSSTARFFLLSLQIEYRWHIADSRVHILAIIGSFRAADFEFVLHGWHVINGSTRNVKYFEQDGSQHSLGSILKQKDEVLVDDRFLNHVLPKQAQRAKQNQLTCILCRSITDALSLLIGRGVLLTTTRNTHCSQLQHSKKGRCVCE